MFYSVSAVWYKNLFKKANKKKYIMNLKEIKIIMALNEQYILVCFYTDSQVYKLSDGNVIILLIC